jgi:hypothetical protein
MELSQAQRDGLDLLEVDKSNACCDWRLHVELMLIILLVVNYQLSDEMKLIITVLVVQVVLVN